MHKSIETIKRKYLAKITEVRQDVISGKIDSRRGFAKVSIITRNFVKAAVGIDVQNYTLDEIAALRMNSLLRCLYRTAMNLNSPVSRPN